MLKALTWFEPSFWFLFFPFSCHLLCLCCCCCCCKASKALKYLFNGNYCLNLRQNISNIFTVLTWNSKNTSKLGWFKHLNESSLGQIFLLLFPQLSSFRLPNIANNFAAIHRFVKPSILLKACRYLS